ncbi:prolipoprotein diacylglyceryl transferase [Luteitalea pratensis]|uniref:Prolipoprotein diacylglyceryl transferase n=1 Tax=Luteitalea pratensis TaxID=1855912 RepID=A0A143PKZ3_LUTPR|nr:prolipoprotein diacylglyceryl transferase [Luteitalea pratensis]
MVLHPHVAFEALAYSSGYYLYRRQRRSGDVVDARARWWIVGAAILGGFIGSHLLAAFEEPSRSLTHWPQLRLVFGGKTIVGGLIGALLTVEWAKRLLGITVATGDLFAVPLILGIGIGRIGCFLSGLDDQSYGIPTGLPWGIDLGDGVRRHPTQLYEMLLLAGLGGMLVSRLGLNATAGDRFKCFMVAYMGCRLLVDVIKPAVRFGGLSAIQWTCLAVLVYYAPHVPRLIAEVRRG